MVPFPTRAFVQNEFFTTVASVFTFIFSFSFLYPASRLLRGVVYEKEAKIREGMYVSLRGSGASEEGA